MSKVCYICNQSHANLYANGDRYVHAECKEKKMSAIPVKMSEQEYQEHCNDNDGVCLACGAIRYGDTEPDAEEYPCEECGEDKVSGMENSLITGDVEVTD